MLAEVLGELVDPGGQERDLHMGRASVLLTATVLADDVLLRFLGEGQTASFAGARLRRRSKPCRLRRCGRLTRLRSPSAPRGSTRVRPRLRSAARVATRGLSPRVGPGRRG